MIASLVDAILSENIAGVHRWLAMGEDVNQLDIYGFTPLIEAAIVDNVEISRLLLNHGADVNLQDVTGGTPLHWAAENNNRALCELLLQHHANPNHTNVAGQPVLTMPVLRQQQALRNFLIKSGANLEFTQDYINTKLLGHVFELTGPAAIISPDNQYIEVDFEGFYPEVTVALIMHALSDFQRHFAARKLRRYFEMGNIIIDCLKRAGQLIAYQQYRVNRENVSGDIDRLLSKEPYILPVGYEGHAIAFIKYGEYWVKCDRREESRLYDNIVVYRVNRPKQCDHAFIKNLIYNKQESEFINKTLDELLALEPVITLKIESQIAGNCSWANIEATIPALLFLLLSKSEKQAKKHAHYQTIAMSFFHRWREWNKARLLQFCIQSYHASDSLRRACKAEILAAILFQRCDLDNRMDRSRIASILSILLHSPYKYLLNNYLRVYYYEGMTPEGKRFAEFLKQYDDTV